MISFCMAASLCSASAAVDFGSFMAEKKSLNAAVSLSTVSSTYGHIHLEI